jgi:hypothetical protein
VPRWFLYVSPGETGTVVFNQIAELPALENDPARHIVHSQRLIIQSRAEDLAIPKDASSS